MQGFYAELCNVCVFLRSAVSSDGMPKRQSAPKPQAKSSSLKFEMQTTPRFLNPISPETYSVNIVKPKPEDLDAQTESNNNLSNPTESCKRV